MRFFVVFYSLLLTSCVTGQVKHHRSMQQNSTPPEKPKAESVISIFRDFKRFPGMDSLIENGRITSAGDEETYTTIIDIDTAQNALRTETTTSGNSSFEVNEYRVVTGSNLTKLIYSSFVGTKAFITQDKIEVYDYSLLTHKFALDTVSSHFFAPDVGAFFYETAPDSVISGYLTHSSNFFHIVYNTTGVAEYILYDHIGSGDQKENKWIKGNTVRFEFTQNKFTRSQPYFAD